ncbi:MAG: DNA gyrase C-terminal beta-propeller domain-containing protein, partial [Adhaeribacter sp.]
RHEVVIRRTEYELAEALKRAHILEGLLIALDNLDEVISLIRSSRDPEIARAGLIERFSLSDIQARAILDMRLQRLTGLERDKIVKEYEEIMALITHLKEILASEELRMQIIKNELTEVRDRYGDARRTNVEMAASDFSMEDMIPDESMVITISHEGYIKRTNLSEYRSQSRGGVGSRGVAASKQADFTEHLFIASTHNFMLFFTELGRVYWLKVYEIPEGGKTTKGRAIQNLIQITKEDKIRAVINVHDLKNPDYVLNNYLIFCTEKGIIKKTPLEAYSRPRLNGINAITINEGDCLLDVQLTNGTNDIVMALKSGRAVRFNEEKVRSMGRNAAGVRGVTLANDEDKVVGMVCVKDEQMNLLVVSEKGYGKKSAIEEYRITNRGGKGVKTLNITEKTGFLVGIHGVIDTDDLMIINKSGITIRLRVADLRVIGRATQGVRLLKINEGDEISSVAKIENDDKAEAEEISEEVLSQSELPAQESLNPDLIDPDLINEN